MAVFVSRRASRSQRARARTEGEKGKGKGDNGEKKRKEQKNEKRKWTEKEKSKKEKHGGGGGGGGGEAPLRAARCAREARPKTRVYTGFPSEARKRGLAPPVLRGPAARARRD